MKIKLIVIKQAVKKTRTIRNNKHALITRLFVAFGGIKAALFQN